MAQVSSPAGHQRAKTPALRLPLRQPHVRTLSLPARLSLELLESLLQTLGSADARLRLAQREFRCAFSRLTGFALVAAKFHRPTLKRSYTFDRA
jgi:hypothetical protein